MLKSVIRFCTNEPYLVMAAVIGISVAGWFSFKAVPIDAIPNVGENQVIVVTPWSGRSPKDIEDQITYPLSISLSATPGSTSVRGRSLFGCSFVQVTFADNVDFYWARSRASEQLGVAASQLPDGVSPQLGPDATGLGQVLYYVLEPPQEGMSLADLRSMQDFIIKYELQAVEGVSEVASIGGYVRQYQIEVDPDKLRYFGIPLDKVMMAVKDSNLDVGAKTLETNGMEFILRGKGILGEGGESASAIQDLEATVVEQRDGVPVRIRDLATVQLGPDFRRGALDFNGVEAVGGVVAMRYGENPQSVIARVHAKIDQIEPSLQGVTIRPVYDRTVLIDETIATLSDALLEEILITSAVILLFLLHIRSSFIVAICLPVAVLISFIAMRIAGVESNIMSLAGIAIAIGTMVDMGIIVSENVFQKIAENQSKNKSTPADHPELIQRAAIEVVPAVVTAVMTTIVSFLPVFFLTGRDYRLFAPLAYTKTFAIAAALITAVTIVPALSRILLRNTKGKTRHAWVAASAMAGIFASLSQFVWGYRLAEWLNAPLWIVTCSLAVLGFVFGWLTFRSRVTGVYLSIISQAMTYALLLAFFRNDMGFGGNNGLTDFKDILGYSLQDGGTRVTLFICSVIALGIGYVLCRYIVTSKLGRVLIGIRDAEDRVRFLGYRVEYYKLFVFTVSSVLAGIAGALYVPQVGIINPSEFAPAVSIEIVIWVAIGGRGSLYGAALGAVLVNYAKTYFTGALPDVWLFMLGGLFIAVTLFLPKGIVGSVPAFDGFKGVLRRRSRTQAEASADG